MTTLASTESRHGAICYFLSSFYATFQTFCGHRASLVHRCQKIVRHAGIVLTHIDSMGNQALALDLTHDLVQDLGCCLVHAPARQ